MGKCLFMRKGETHTAPISGILASDLAVGSSVYLMEGGVATEYLVVNQGKPSGSSLYDDSCNGTWLLRKDIKENRQWHDSQVNDYANSDIHAWLNGDFLNLFDVDIQAAINEAKIPYVYGTGDFGSVVTVTNVLSAKIFLLSGYEVGGTASDVNQYFPVDGAKLDYFESGITDSANHKRIAYINGSALGWCLRSPDTFYTSSLWIVNVNGNFSSSAANNTLGIRPALVLPSNALFDKNTLILKGVA